jgi:hypothetical protein
MHSGKIESRVVAFTWTYADRDLSVTIVYEVLDTDHGGRLLSLARFEPHVGVQSATLIRRAAGNLTRHIRFRRFLRNLHS